MTHKELQSSIIEIATKFGWQHYHTFNSRKSDTGFPDLVLIHADRGRIVYAEIKSDTGKTSHEQDEWLEMLARCDQEVYIWYPRHLEEIVMILMLGHKPSVAERMEMDSAVIYCAENKEDKK